MTCPPHSDGRCKCSTRPDSTRLARSIRHVSRHRSTPRKTQQNGTKTGSRSLISKTLFLIKQIRPRTSQVYNLRTPIPILLQTRTLEAIEGIADSLATADNALILVISEGAFVADADEGGWAHVGIADGAFAIAFIAETADGDAGLFAAHDEVGVVARHCAF